MTQEFFTVQQVAKRLGMGSTTVRTKFAEVPGVIALGGKDHEYLRIPESAIQWFIDKSLLSRPAASFPMRPTHNVIKSRLLSSNKSAVAIPGRLNRRVSEQKLNIAKVSA